MKRLAVPPAALLVLAAACGDTGTLAGPDGPLFNAEFDLDAPAFTTASATGSTVSLEWTWSDDEDWELVSFKLKRDGTEIAGDPTIPNRKPYSAAGDGTLTRSYTDTGLADGTYEYCVEVNAHNFERQPNTTHHGSACTTVAVTTVHIHQLAITATGGNSQSGQLPNASTGTLTLDFQLYHDGGLVTGCAILLSAATSKGSVSQNSCNAATSTYHVNVTRPAAGWGGTGSTITLGFTVASGLSGPYAPNPVTFNVTVP